MQDLQPSLDGAPFRLIGALRHRPIFHEGDTVAAVYRVERGCVRLQIEARSGEREVVSFLFAGDVLAAGFGIHWASAYAVTDVVLAVFPMQSLKAHLAQDPQAALNLLQTADSRLDDVSHHLGLLSHASAGARMRWFLAWLTTRTACTDGSGAIHLPMSRRDIADFLGIAPETVSRLFRRLEARGELRRTTGRRCILYPGASRARPAPEDVRQAVA